ncbi:hypothetical protein PENTCL1PPCAC_8845, partial [Pristionchus entomophagus]
KRGPECHKGCLTFACKMHRLLLLLCICILHLAPAESACTAGWTGANCDQDVNECAYANPVCLNGGTCVNKPGSYECLCTALARGLNCETGIPSGEQLLASVRPALPAALQNRNAAANAMQRDRNSVEQVKFGWQVIAVAIAMSVFIQ